jgi:hypothetical protein
MVADFSKLLCHPDKDEVISKIVTGIAPKNISEWLKVKYPDKDQAHLRLSSAMLKEFADNNIDLYSAMRNDLNSVKAGNQIAKQTSQSLLNNKTYQEKLLEVADKEIDIKRSITDTMFLIKGRIEQVWDKVQENPHNINMKPDYALIKWFELLLSCEEKWNKIHNGTADTVVNQNITVNMIEQHSALFQDAVRETLAEIDPDAAFLFMDKLNVKLNSLKEPKEEVISQDKKLQEVKILHTQIKKESDDE